MENNKQELMDFLDKKYLDEILGTDDVEDYTLDYLKSEQIGTNETLSEIQEDKELVKASFEAIEFNENEIKELENKKQTMQSKQETKRHNVLDKIRNIRKEMKEAEKDQSSIEAQMEIADLIEKEEKLIQEVNEINRSISNALGEFEKQITQRKEYITKFEKEIDTVANKWGYEPKEQTQKQGNEKNDKPKIKEEKQKPESASVEHQEPEPASAETQESESASAEAQEPEPTPAEAQEPEPTSAEAQAPEPTPAEAQEPEPTPAEAQEPEPASAEAQEPEPTPAEAQEPEPASAEAQEPEPTPAEAQEPEPASAEAQEPEPTPAEAQEPEPTPTGTPAPTGRPVPTPTGRPAPTGRPEPAPTGRPAPTGAVPLEKKYSIEQIEIDEENFNNEGGKVTLQLKDENWGGVTENVNISFKEANKIMKSKEIKNIIKNIAGKRNSNPIKSWRDLRAIRKNINPLIIAAIQKSEYIEQSKEIDASKYIKDYITTVYDYRIKNFIDYLPFEIKHSRTNSKIKGRYDRMMNRAAQAIEGLPNSTVEGIKQTLGDKIKALLSPKETPKLGAAQSGIQTGDDDKWKNAIRRDAPSLSKQKKDAQERAEQGQNHDIDVNEIAETINQQYHDPEH